MLYLYEQCLFYEDTTGIPASLVAFRKKKKKSTCLITCRPEAN